MENYETRSFKIIVFIVTSLIAGLLLAYIVYFSELRNGKVLSKGEITSMLIITGVLFAINIMLWIWALVRLFFSRNTRQVYIDTTKSRIKGYFNDTNSGYTVPYPARRGASVASQPVRSVRTSASSELPVTKREESIAADL